MPFDKASFFKNIFLILPVSINELSRILKLAE